MDIILAIIHISCAMSSKSSSVCLKGYVNFQDHQTRYVYSKMFFFLQVNYFGGGGGGDDDDDN
jgi:hypothetical protein